jgi:glutamate 5-kinase
MKKIVVKLGSSVIAPAGKLDPKLVAALVKDILALEQKGCQAVLVSSGAIACGLNRLGYQKKPHETTTLMAIASVGQIILMDVFNEKFNAHKRSCAQILLTWADFDDRNRYINIRKTIDTLLAMKVIPVINENDAVTSEEIKFGDNDWTAARVADLIEADTLVILSDVEGLYDGTTIVKRVVRIDDKVKSLVRKVDKTHTHGGMGTKLEAATSASYAGIKTVIALGREKNVLTRIAKGEEVGTLFLPMEQKENSRKRWIFSKPVKGTLTIDDGARHALLCGNKSLLGVGVIKVEGEFHKGDAVAVVDNEGISLGCGITNYGSAQIVPKIKLENELIHHDNFIREAAGWCYSPYRYSAKKDS